MKKISILISMLLVLTMIAAMNVSAASQDILKGTPVIDGVVDDIWKQSLALDAGKGPNAYETPWNDANGTIYFLYDAQYLYICAEINDNDVVTKGEDYAKSSNPYQNDNCEFRLSLDGGETTIKVGVDAYGYACYGLDANYEVADYSQFIYKTSHTDTSYVIEVAIPCTKGVLNMIGAGKLGFKLQLNDLAADCTSHVNHATDYAGEGPKGLVYYNLSSEEVVVAVPEEPAEDTGAAVADVTGDPMMLFAVIAMASGALVFKRRH